MTSQIDNNTSATSNGVIPAENNEQHGENVVPLEAPVEHDVLAGLELETIGREFKIYNDFTGEQSDNSTKALMRPTLISMETWTLGAYNHSFDPFAQLYTNAILKRYLANVAYFSMDAVVRVVMNGDPTTFGRLIMSYSTNLNSTGRSTTATDHEHMLYPHMLLDPSTSGAYEFIVPGYTRSGTLCNDPIAGAQYGCDGGNMLVNFDAFGTGLGSSHGTPNPVKYTIMVYYKNVKLYGNVNYTSLAVDDVDAELESVKVPKTGKSAGVGNHIDEILQSPVNDAIKDVSTAMGVPMDPAKAIGDLATIIGGGNPYAESFESGMGMTGSSALTLPLEDAWRPQPMMSANRLHQSYYLKKKNKLVYTSLESKGEVADPPLTIRQRARKALTGLDTIRSAIQFPTPLDYVSKFGSVMGSLFGFSHPVIPNFSSFGIDAASVNAPVAAGVLSTDSHAQVTVDGKVYGDDDPDPLAISAFTGRYGYVSSMALSTTASVGDKLSVIPVTPGFVTYESVAQKVIPTPLSHAAVLYQFWSGDITYRITAVSNKFCRGAVAFRHVTYPEDPTDISINTTALASTDYMATMDIADNASIEFTVPYKQGAPMLPVCFWPHNVVIPDASRVDSVANLSSLNGVIYAEVVSPLSTPLTVNNIYFIIEIRAGPNLILSSPTLGLITSACVTQTAITTLGTGKSFDPAKLTTGTAELSLRPLLKIPQPIAYYYETPAQYATFFSFALMLRLPRLAAEADVTHILPLGLNGTELCLTYRNWIAPVFVFERGGTHYAIFRRTASNNSAINSEMVSSPGIATRLPAQLLSRTYDGGANIVSFQPVVTTAVSHNITTPVMSISTVERDGAVPGPQVLADMNTNCLEFILSDESPVMLRTTTKAGKTVNIMQGDAQAALVTLPQSENSGVAWTCNAAIYGCGSDDYGLYHYYALPVYTVTATGTVFWQTTPPP